MVTELSTDTTKTEAFLERVLADTSATTVTVLAGIGDRLGLFKALANSGPATSVELASRAGTNERYTREWLGAMASAGYLEYDSGSTRFTLPSEHVPILADEAGPIFFGGVHQMLTGMIGPIKLLERAFCEGGGVPQSAYDDYLWDGMERFSAGFYENRLLQEWIPAMPDVQSKLERGVDVCDVGCGRGRALIKLAQAFPNSRFTGYDVFEPTIARATANAEAAGVADLIRFEARDVSRGIPASYDVITTWDVVHDAVDPLGLLQAIRKALKPDGIYVCLEINASHRLEENAGPIGAMSYGFSVLYCMTTSLAHHGEGLGTAGANEHKLRELCPEAGFSSVYRLPVEDAFNILYEIRP
jgi:2-polyprenyl-3-methyl-5-hydroxy-6-metoxy-1,4-benzoquinol methylase